MKLSALSSYLRSLRTLKTSSRQQKENHRETSKSQKKKQTKACRKKSKQQEKKQRKASIRRSKNGNLANNVDVPFKGKFTHSLLFLNFTILLCSINIYLFIYVLSMIFLVIATFLLQFVDKSMISVP